MTATGTAALIINESPVIGRRKKRSNCRQPDAVHFVAVKYRAETGKQTLGQPNIASLCNFVDASSLSTGHHSCICFQVLKRLFIFHFMKSFQFIHFKNLSHILKNAAVVPMHKSGSKSTLSNYRLVSLLSTLLKKIENLMCTRLKHHLSLNYE